VPSARSRGDSSCRLGSGIFRVIVRRRAGLNLVTRGGHLGHCPLPRTTRSMYSCQSGCLPRGHRHQARTCSFASTWGAPAIRLRPPGGCDFDLLAATLGRVVLAGTHRVRGCLLRAQPPLPAGCAPTRARRTSPWCEMRPGRPRSHTGYAGSPAPRHTPAHRPRRRTPPAAPRHRSDGCPPFP
jgi:hypothetical protein